MHCQNIVDERCLQKEFLKTFLLNKVYFPNFANRYILKPVWPFSCDYSFWLRDLKFGMCIKDPINKRCWKNGKDLSNGATKIKLWNHAKKTHFLVFAKNFRRPWMKLKNIFGQFPNPSTLRVSGMGGYTSKCEKKSKSLHPTLHPHQPGLIFPSWWNIRHKSAIATLCSLCGWFVQCVNCTASYKCTYCMYRR
jgi:hypothetical protein